MSTRFLTALPPRLARAIERWHSQRAPLPALLQRLVDREPLLPMAIGSFDALTARYPEATKTEVRRLMRLVSSCDSYLRACAAEGALRHDNDGNPVELVSDEHRAIAVERLAANKVTRKKTVEAIPAPVAVAVPAIAEPVPASPKRAGLADLKAMAQKRRAVTT